MRFIPLICASRSNISIIPSGTGINYYPKENGNAGAADNDLTAVLKAANIKMVHLQVPGDVSRTYRENSEYIEWIRMLGKVGVTIHYKTPKCAADENILFEQILHLHLDMPEAVWYVENEHNDAYGLIGFVQRLRDLGIEAYICLDTCHLNMDLYQDKYKGTTYRHTMFDYLKLFSPYIGAYHLSASREYDGLILETHGKPVVTTEDEAYFKHLVRSLCKLRYKNNVYMIAEVTESDYSAEGGRKNGKKAYEIMERVLKEGLFITIRK